MTFSKLAVWAIAITLAVGCGKVRDGTDDTSADEGDGGDGSSGGAGDGSGGDGNGGDGSGGRGSGSGGRNGSGGASSGDGGAGSGGGGGTDNSGAAANSGGAESSGGTTSSGGAPNTGGAFVEEEGTKAMRAGPTVWVGQTEMLVTYPAVLEEDWSTPQKMVLILDRIATGVTGTVTFGSSPPPPAPTVPGGPWPPQRAELEPGQSLVSDTNLTYSPYDGFSYSIVGSELRGNTLTLAFVPLELWQPWCEIQDAVTARTEVCQCEENECRALDGPTRRLELVVSGTTLSGQLSRPPGNWFGETPALKLERVQ